MKWHKAQIHMAVKYGTESDPNGITANLLEGATVS